MNIAPYRQVVVMLNSLVQGGLKIRYGLGEIFGGQADSGQKAEAECQQVSGNQSGAETHQGCYSHYRCPLSVSLSPRRGDHILVLMGSTLFVWRFQHYSIIPNDFVG